jgi:hypothetical protein
MTVVLMDTRRHKTVDLLDLSAKVLVPVEVVEGQTVLDFNRAMSIMIRNAEFAHQGDFLRGDPIYLQVRGPEIPARWWDR